MKISKYRNSKWLTKEDVDALTPEQRRTVVTKVEEDEVGEVLKPVTYFKGIVKGWPTNMTGLEVLAELSGSPDTEDFVGVKVEVFVDPDVRYAGKRVGGIKLRPIPSKLPVNDDGAPFDDAIHF